MHIDLFSDRLLSFSQAAKRLPNRPAVSTIWRWHQVGVQGVRLPAIKVGAVYHTSEEALQWFCEQLTAQARGDKPVRVTAKGRQSAIDEAEREFEELVSR